MSYGQIGPFARKSAASADATATSARTNRDFMSTSVVGFVSQAWLLLTEVSTFCGQ